MRFYIILMIFIGALHSECSDYSSSNICTSDSNCEWVEDIETGNCNDFGSSLCENYSDYGCSWEFSWGGWQNYGSSCVGGTYQINNSYCEEVEHQLGDINGDYMMNILDIVASVELILNNQFNWIADMNLDNLVNVLDVVMMVDIILGN